MNAPSKDGVKFSIGQTVWLVVNPERCGMVTAIIFNAVGIYYSISWDNMNVANHYDIELCSEKPTVTA